MVQLYSTAPMNTIVGDARLLLLFADNCLAQETLQRSKGDAKQSTLQRFAPGSRQTTTSAAPCQLRRSLTAAASSNPAKQKRKARRSSSDSASLLSGGQQQQHAAGSSPDVDADSEEVLPNRLLKHKPGTQHTSHDTCPTTTPVAAHEARANTAAESDTTKLQSSTPLLPACVHIQTSIVGRRFRSNISCTRHTQVLLVRQPDNSRDSNAIQIVDAARQAALGYLPKEIAQHLAGLLDAGMVQVTATVDEPKSVAAAVPILLEVLCFLTSHFWKAGLLSSCLSLYTFAFPLVWCTSVAPWVDVRYKMNIKDCQHSKHCSEAQTLSSGVMDRVCGIYCICYPCHMQGQAMRPNPPSPPTLPMTSSRVVIYFSVLIVSLGNQGLLHRSLMVMHCSRRSSRPYKHWYGQQQTGRLLACSVRPPIQGFACAPTSGSWQTLL